MKRIITIAVNLFLAASTLAIVIINMIDSNKEADSSVTGFKGAENLRFFTVDSNILMAVCAVIFLVFYCMRKDVFPKWLSVFMLTAAASVGVTFFTVVCFLGPGQAALGRGYFSLFRGSNLFFHLINPVLGMADLIFLAPQYHYTVRSCIYGVIPTAVYSFVYAAMVLTRRWPDFYNFTFRGHYWMTPLVIIIFVLLSFVISVILSRTHNKVQSKH